MENPASNAPVLAPETKIRRAVIDVGTNSIKLLVADVAGNIVHPIVEDSQQTRLGAGFFETRRLQPKAIKQSAAASAAFADHARELRAVSIRVIATSAARDAVNQNDLTSAIEQACGLKVEVISGDQEADMAFRGATTDPELADQPLLLLDVGGGSTEFILGRGERKHFSQSFQLGTVRLLEKLSLADPPTPAQLAQCRDDIRQFLEKEVRPKLEPAMHREQPAQLAATGGTVAIMARMEHKLRSYDRAKIESTRLTLEQIHNRTEKLWSLPLAERQTVTGLPKQRADVILTGVAIYEVLMQVFGFDQLRVSTRGLRFAAVMQPD